MTRARICVTLAWLVCGFIGAGAYAVGPALNGVEVEYRRGYVDAAFGQVHYHSARPRSRAPSAAPVVLFHQAPKSAWEYEYLLRDLGRDRLVLALDTPGYGDSDRPAEPVSLEALVEAMAIAIDTLATELSFGRFDVFGFHTGAFLATELALQRPDGVRAVVLSGIAYRTAAEKAALLQELPQGFDFPEDGSRLTDRWRRIVVEREDGVSLERATRMFLEDIHSLGYWWYSYVAVWNYPVADRLAAIRQPLLILQPHEMLLEETRRIHREVVPQAAYRELSEVNHPVRVFETGSPAIAEAMRAWLDSID